VAIFSVVYGVLLRPLPYFQPDRLVELREVNSHGGLMNFADPNFEDVRASSQALDGVAEYGAWLESVAGPWPWRAEGSACCWRNGEWTRCWPLLR
jgi:hypothetical protein